MCGHGGGDFISNILKFTYQLRERGLRITPGRIIDTFRSLPFIDLAIRQDFYATLKINLVSSQEETAIFDEIFERFWRQMQETPPRIPTPGADKSGDGEDLGKRIPEIIGTLAATTADKESKEKHGGYYSPHETLLTKDFSHFPEEEREMLNRELARLLTEISSRLSRRRKPSTRGREVDFRRSLRRALLYGGEIIELLRRRRKKKPLKIIVICDVSGSMESSTLLTLQFIFNLLKFFPQSDFFVFSTRLTRITDILKGNTWREALSKIGERAMDWYGGTKIGYCLGLFNQRYAKDMAPGSIVTILISDGWDRGESALLDGEMKKLKRKSRRIIWANPLLGAPGYEPLAIGMRTALPYIDYFLPASNLKGLSELGKVLTELS